VREALKKLEQMGLVTSQQGSGTRVRSIEEASLDVLMNLLFFDGRPNVPWIRDFLDLREALAPGVVRLAVERASEEEINEVADLFKRCVNSELSDLAYLEAVLSASDALARASHNRIVVQVWNSLRRVMTQIPFQKLLVAAAGSRGRIAPGIKRFSVAIAARDLTTAVRAIHEVLGRFREVVLAAIEVPPKASAPSRRGEKPHPPA
jgi:GntR family transcriptional repressor for pyruvate dehydrogenase complex